MIRRLKLGIISVTKFKQSVFSMNLHKIALGYSIALTFATTGVGLNYSAPANAQELITTKLLLSQAGSGKSTLTNYVFSCCIIHLFEKKLPLSKYFYLH
jgi:putative ribosome biogenesis GTPase RsgA